MALKLFIEVGGSYVCFGLALYAISAVASFAWLRLHSDEDQRPCHSAAFRICFCLVALIVLEAVRQIGDSLQYQLFPVWITRLMLPGIYFILGNSAFALVHRELDKHAAELVVHKPARPRKRKAVAAVSPNLRESAESSQLLARVTSKF